MLRMCGAGAALYELTLSGAAEKLFAFNQNPAAREHNVRHASYFDALEHRIVHPHVMGLRADRVLPFGIENYQVGVAAYRDRAFAGIEAEEFGRSGGDQLDEAVYAETSLRDAPRVHQAHAVFDAGTAVRNLGEVANPHFLLLLEAEWAMVG